MNFEDKSQWVQAAKITLLAYGVYLPLKYLAQITLLAKSIEQFCTISSNIIQSS